MHVFLYLMGRISTMIVGLGNLAFLETRHSIGMKICNALATHHGAIWQYERKYKAYTTSFVYEGSEIMLLKSNLPMNINGRSILKAVKELDIASDDLVLVHDDLCRSFGKISWKFNGSAGGHNGVKSVISCLSSTDFKRLRIGIGRPEDRNYVINYVTDTFTERELEILECVVEKCVRMIHEDILKGHSHPS